MNVTAIVALSVLAALFSVFLIAIGASIAILQYQLTRSFRSTATATLKLSEDLKLLSSQIGATLELHRTQMEEKISRVNGAQLAEAAKLSTQSASRIERSANAMADLARSIFSEEALGEIGEGDLARARRTGLGPGSFAPAEPGERFTSTGRTARGDLEDQLDFESETSPETAPEGEVLS